MARTCLKSIHWDTEGSSRATDYRAARRRASDMPFVSERYRIAKQRLGLIYDRRSPDSERSIAVVFRRHADKWRDETMHLSSLSRRFLHPSYLRIISLGEPVLPFLLEELKDRPDHWLVALNAITEHDPAALGATFNDAVAAWIEWGEVQDLC